MSDALSAYAAGDAATAARLLERIQKRIIVPTPAQARVEASDARFKILRAGRRTGKTKIAARTIMRATIGSPNSMNWWVANTWKNTKRGYRQVLAMVPPEILAKPAPSADSNELALYFKNGATLEFYTAGTPDAMAGEGVHFVVVDEAALIPEHVWFQIIRPTLMDVQGRALIVSTPRGRNWFWRLDDWGGFAGKHAPKPGYESFHFTSYDNPYLPREDIEESRESMPERLFNQEVLAQYIANADALFNLEHAHVVEGYDPALAARQTLAVGIDLAKRIDFTVIWAMDSRGRLVFHDRFQQGISWPVQRELIVEHLRDLAEVADSVTVGIDSTGLGDVVYDDLDALGEFDIVPINFSPVQKHKMVKLLGADIEKQRVQLLESAMDEFEAYQYSIGPSGNFKYSAPEGQHDDQVSAAMLANWVRVHEAATAGEVRSWDEQEDEDVAGLKQQLTQALARLDEGAARELERTIIQAQDDPNVTVFRADQADFDRMLHGHGQEAGWRGI